MTYIVLVGHQALLNQSWWRNYDASSLRRIWIETKQPNFKRRTFSL